MGTKTPFHIRCRMHARDLNLEIFIVGAPSSVLAWVRAHHGRVGVGRLRATVHSFRVSTLVERILI